jgi:hypothetical protein
MGNTRRAGTKLAEHNHGAAYSENPPETGHFSPKSSATFATSLALCNKHFAFGIAKRRFVCCCPREHAARISRGTNQG